MHFGTSEKWMTDYMLLYNNVGLTSKFYEETASKNNENCRCRQAHCHL